MRTYEQIFKEMFDDIYKSPEGWPDNISIAEVYNRAAKEYAKQWIHEFACQTFIHVDTYDYRGVLSDLEPEILKRIGGTMKAIKL